MDIYKIALIMVLSAFSGVPALSSDLSGIVVRRVCEPHASGAPIRSAPASTGPVIDTLPNGSSVRAISRTVDDDAWSWLQIEYARDHQRLTGYVAEVFLLNRCRAPAPSDPDGAPPVHTAFSNTWLPVTSTAPATWETSTDPEFLDGAALVQNGARFGYIDRNGQWIVEPIFDKAAKFRDGAAPVRVNGLYGMIDARGQWLVEPILRELSVFKEWPALAITIEGKYGFIDQKGRWSVSPKFDDAFFFTQGFAPVRLAGKYGFIDQTGRVVIPLVFDFAGEFSGEYGLVKIGDTHAFIDRTGKIVAGPGFTAVGTDIATDGVARACVATAKCGYIDLTIGKWILEPQFSSSLSTFEDGVASVSRDGRSNFVDRAGRFLFPDRLFTDAENLSEGLAAIKENGLWGYIDREGRTVIEPQFKFADSFHHGVARVLLDGDRLGIIDRSGHWIIEPLREDITVSDDRILVRNKATTRAFDFSGRPLPSGKK